ncbi:hypothetical protein PVAP13_7KG054054 [Panicum virgatum]|uniref:Uncharacterized protein n=1 Tax=Panicum virgatum TaxID=38727 RepID=A0A8T0QJW9_PANVG|nr:hypothetical protein PVAP13_7KG054054 [Panicum virgatum]
MDKGVAPYRCTMPLFEMEWEIKSIYICSVTTPVSSKAGSPAHFTSPVSSPTPQPLLKKNVARGEGGSKPRP